jgi:ABC-type multidrug transport system ATPase subunit
MWELRCESLGKRFGERWVFRGLNLHLKQGMVLMVRGANGSGKTTLIRLMAGLLAPTEGRIQLLQKGSAHFGSGHAGSAGAQRMARSIAN